MGGGREFFVCGDCLVVFEMASEHRGLSSLHFSHSFSEQQAWERLGHTQEAGGGKFGAINLMDCNPAPASSRSSLGWAVGWSDRVHGNAPSPGSSVTCWGVQAGSDSSSLKALSV